MFNRIVQEKISCIDEISELILRGKRLRAYLYENTRKFRRLIKEETKGSRYRGNVVFPIKLILNFDRTEFTVLERQNNIVEVEGAV